MKKIGNYLHTFMGHKVDPLNAKVEDICIEDIAHALSLLCRWGGHTKVLLSVAEHSMLVSYYTLLATKSSKLAFAALLHDASEAYMQDIVSPIKHRLKDYCRAEKRLERVIFKRFGIKFTKQEYARIKEQDLNVRRVEYKLKKGLFTAKEAERNFLRCFILLDTLVGCKLTVPYDYVKRRLECNLILS